jgi:N-acetyl-1-D-myo-inositol-2-amino-2-deoxy-alpha-D-glucopyranoside deacetylase
MNEMNEKKKILVVLAHPDDESFGMGGTLAYYAKQGVEVHLVCATRGEAGEVSSELMEGYDSIAKLRENELRCAAGILGLASVHFLEYRDSGMPGSGDNQHPNALINAPLHEVASKVTCYIRDIRPEVVITFDPVGGYHHPDHIAIHKATVKAFYAAGDYKAYPNGKKPFQPGKLYYSVFPRGFIRFAVRLIKLFGKNPAKFGRNNDIDLEMLAGDEVYPPHAQVNYRSVADLKQQADACHASQFDFGSQSSVLMRLFRKVAYGKDSFMRAFPPAPEKFRIKDLFEG